MAHRRFQGKVALVTGAGRGIGRETAELLAAEGARVAVNALHLGSAAAVADAIVAEGGEARPFGADVSDDIQVESMVSGIVGEWGTVDILINNAGVLGLGSPLESIPVDDWDRVMAVNLRAAFLCTKYVIPYMKARRSGKIINVSSTAARSSAAMSGAHYTASKAGLLGLTRHTAREAGPFNINVNAVTPGTINTDMVRQADQPDRVEAIRLAIPLLRLGEAADVAKVIVFLCSEDARHIHGATIDINGGQLIV